MGDTEEPTLMQAQSIIVIHTGSLYLKIGRASDLNPHTELHALARKRLYGGLPHTDRLLPPLICKLKEIELELDKCRLSISHCLQSCPMSDGQRRYATPPQQIAQYNRRSRPEPVNNSVITEWVKPELDVVVGTEVLNINPSWEYNIHFPIKRGELNIHSGVGGSLTAVLADLECIWSWVIQNKLQIPLQDLKNYRAVLVVPDIYNRQYLRELTTLLLQMGFSSCFLLQDHVGATFGAGLGTACVVDCGHSKTSVSCVEDGISHPATRVRLPYGGGDITQCLYWLLNKSSFPYKECNPLNPLDALLLEKFKQESCHVDLDVCGCRERSFIVNQPRKQPSKYTVQVGDECMIAPLSLFQPELLNLTGPKVMVTQKRNTGDPSDPHDSDYLRETGRKGKEAPETNVEGGGTTAADEDIVDIEMTGDTEFTAGPPSQLLSVDQAILQSIQRCVSDDLKKKMYSSILVVGGGMKFKGISNWLQKKISLQIPSNLRPEQTDIVTTPMDPMIVAWKGAAILACLESAHELWITKAEWEKYGVKVRSLRYGGKRLNACLQLLQRSYCTYYDPPYLESMKPKIPLYGPVNVQIKGYDFALLESYQKLVNKIATIMDIEVADGWATPAKVEKVQKFKPNSTTVECEYTLSTYERNIQVVDIPVNILPVFIEMIQAALPQGVSFEIHEHLEEHETIRYVPDFELKELKSKLETFGGPVKKK